MYEAAVSDDRGKEYRTLREMIDSGEATLGGWCTIPSSFGAEILALAGFDWMCIDAQHGLFGYEQMTRVLRALELRSVGTFVRVPWNDPSSIMKALDAGAEGVIVPMVNTAEEAGAAVQASRYPPLGFRSWGPVRASLGKPSYDPETANRSIVCIVMIETREAVDAVEEIVRVPGVDGILIGPYDLSLSTNLNITTPGQKPRDEEQVARVLQACEAASVPAGIACLSGADARQRRAQGFRLLQLPSDLVLLSQAASGAVREAQGE